CKTAFVAIAVDQWEPMVQFYSCITGQSPHPYRPGGYAEFRLGSLRLGLFRANPSHQDEFIHGRAANISICLEVNHLEQSRQVIEQAYSVLTLPMAHGQLRLGTVAIASHGRECYAYDPDGNRLILHEALSSA
ncbi:MAG: hypothetical protein VKJ64_03545, partial [Leptolyngbyaceae bacterium]|nr:hypothetical protein [Leptolyngbyaceae bacterium]